MFCSHHQKHHQQQVLARIWGRRNPRVLLIGMQANATTLEKNVEASEKSKHRPAI
jgi:hypothetical protein